MTDIEMLTVGNYDVFGKLIETWAIGEDRVNDGKSYLPRPTNMDELKEMLIRAGAAATIPNRYTTFSFAQSTDSNLVIRLPEKNILLSVENDINAGGTWQLPAFYLEDFGARNIDSNASVDDKLQLLAMRIGDYTVGNCRHN